MSVQDLTESLKSGAEKVSEGRIRIDARRALQKLRDHRLADPHHYVLELLRAAVASGAKSAEVRVDSDDFELRFDGAAPTPEVIRDLLSHALGGGKDAESVAARFLALGVAGALGLEPRFVRVLAAGLELEVRPPEAVEVEVKPAARGGTFVQVRERVSWRVLRDAVLGPTELGVIRRAVRRFPAKLTLNGKPHEPELFDEPVLAQLEKTCGNARIVVAAPARRARASTLTLEIFGVGVVTRSFELPLLQVVAWARDDSLRRNASGSDVVDDDPSLEKIKRRVAAIAEELLGELVTRMTQADEPEVRALVTGLALDAARGKRMKEVPASLRAVLDRAPILPGPSGEWVTIGELRAEDRAGRQLRFARAAFPPGTYTRPAVLLADAAQELEILLPRPARIDVAKEVAARREAVERRDTWEKSPVEQPVLPERPYLARARIDTDALSGEVGFVRETSRARLRFLSQGRLVQQTEPFELDPLEVQAVLDLKRALSEKAWMQYPMPLGTGKALAAVRDGAVRALCDALTGEGVRDRRLCEHARAAIVLLVRDERAPRPAELPEALRRAAIFETAGGGAISLDELVKGGCRYTSRRWPHPSLNGYPVVVLREPERKALEKLGLKLKDCSENLAREADIRSRLESSSEVPRVRGGKAASVAIAEEGLSGEVAIPSEGGAGLSLRLLVKGFALEECSVNARYDLAAAAVDCAALKPDEQWRHAQRDENFTRVLEAVKAAERRLAGVLLDRNRDTALVDFASGPRRFLTAFLRKELGGRLRADGEAALDELQQAAAEARLFQGPQGLVSLGQIAQASWKLGKVLVIDRPPPVVPKSAFFVVAEPAMARLLAEIIERPAEDAADEIASALVREAFSGRPERALSLPVGLAPKTNLELEHLRGVAAFDPSIDRGAQVEVLYQRRLLQEALSFPCAIPVRAVVEIVDRAVDPGAGGLSEVLEPLVTSALEQAVARLTAAALADPDGGSGRRVLLLALAARADATLPKETGQRLLSMPLLPSTDGVVRDARAFDALDRVAFVREPLTGTLRSGEPVIVATSPLVWLALGRWRDSAVDVGATLKAEHEGQRRLETLPVVEKVAVSGAALRRQAFSVDGVEGEAALVGENGGRLELLHLRRALCTVAERHVPPCVAVALNFDGLTPNPARTEVVRDAEYDRVLKICARQVEALAKHAAQGYAAAPEAERAVLAPALAQLSLWLFSRKRASGPLAELPLFIRTDGEALCLRELSDEQRRFKRVRVSSSVGAPLAGSWVWRPRSGEVDLLAKGLLKLVDGTADLLRAQQVRSRPKVSSLAVPVASPWREAVTGDGLEGELVFAPGVPSRKLVIEVLREKALLETVTLDHPLGGVARVNCDALKPSRDWTKATRNEEFRHLREGVEQALERLLLRLLTLGKGAAGWRAYATAAVQWKLGAAGPLAAELPRLQLFADLAGRAVALGEVLADLSRYGRIAVAEPGLRADPSFGGVVLQADEATLSLLDELDLKREDVTRDLRRKKDLEASRSARHLASLKYPGEALIRLEVDAGGFKGELALPIEAGPAKQLMLSRAGVGISAFDDGGVGIAGVLDHPDLPVNEDWTQASPSPEMRRVIDDQVVALFGRLSSLEERLGPAERRRAARYVLRFLGDRGISAPAHLDNLPASTWKLASCKLFWTCDGRWVDLRSIASRVLRRGNVAVVDASISADELQGDVVLAEGSLGDQGLAELSEVLGRGAVCRQALAEWRADREEEDPEDGTPLGRGLALLRRESKLLKSGALGRLTADELKQIKLQRRRGKSPIRYDVERKIAALDPDHPAIRRALEDSIARPDRLYVLLAAIYGAVNRALERITDEDELRLVGGLMGHLAANPELLGVSSEPGVD